MNETRFWIKAQRGIKHYARRLRLQWLRASHPALRRGIPHDLLILHGAHHKAGTTWIKAVLWDLSVIFDLPFTICHREQQLKANTRLFLATHSRFDFAALPPYTGSHMIRDPRDIVISGYFYHLWTDETWLLRPQKRYDGKSYQQLLRSLDQEEGLLTEMRRCRNGVFQKLAEWDYHNPRILELKYEDLMADMESGFRALFAHYGLEPDQIELALELAGERSFHKRSGRRPGETREGRHLRSGKPGQWREIFTPRHREWFQENCGDLLIQLGYEQDTRW